MASFRSGRLRGFVGSAAAAEVDDAPGTFEGVGELDAVDEDDARLGTFHGLQHGGDLGHGLVFPV